MSEEAQQRKPRVLILATISCAYPGADAAGQARANYPTNTYILRVPCPVIFPEEFYINCFKKGIDAILVASCGSECPYEGAYQRLSARIDNVYKQMKQLGIEIERLKLTAICTVCGKAFVKEVTQLCQIAEKLGPVKIKLSA